MSDFPREIFSNLLPLSAPNEKPDLCKIGNDIHKVITKSIRPTGYKQRVRRQHIELKPDARYRQGEVAAVLNVGYDTAGRRMLQMKSCVDEGTKTRRYKRGKRLLTVTGRDILARLRNKTVN
jgi:hypothetical protein